MNTYMYTMWINLTSDRRKFVFMCCLILMGLLLWARLLLLGDVPRAGYAETETNEEVANSTDSDNTGETAQEVQTVYINTADSLARDIFSLSSEYKDRLEQSTQSEEQEAKLIKDQSDLIADKRVRGEQIAAEADKLRLESIMFGKTKLAVINGEVVEIGGQIQGFVLEKILDDSVIISKEDNKVTLYMDIPGS